MIPYVGYVDDVDIIHYIYSTPVFLKQPYMIYIYMCVCDMAKYHRLYGYPIHYLVRGLEHFIFFHILGRILFFRGLKPPTRYIWYMIPMAAVPGSSGLRRRSTPAAPLGWRCAAAAPTLRRWSRGDLEKSGWSKGIQQGNQGKNMWKSMVITIFNR